MDIRPFILAAFVGLATPGTSAGTPLAETVRGFADQAARAYAATSGGERWRIEVEPGTLDARLKLAPCDRIEPYLPAGLKPWGRTRVGLRCTAGARWNVTVPVTVRVLGSGLVSAGALPAGTWLEANHFRPAEVDLAGGAMPAQRALDRIVGRQLARPLTAGQALFDADLKKRQVFALGEPVTVIARGNGFAVRGEAFALSAGFEGEPVRLRTEAGRTIQGVATGERRAEVPL